MTISIVSAYYKNEQMTKDFLDNLMGKLPTDTEVILVNAGSQPITHLLINKLINLKENKSFSNSMNNGIRHAKGDYICVIGNDVFPDDPEWLDKLLVLAEKTKAFITSPVNDMSNLPMYKLEKKEDYYEADMFPAVCWLMSRECLDKVGLFDEQFEVGTYEDDDYCKRVHEVGGKIVLSPVSVRHLLSQTLKLFDVGKVMADNRVKYENKWKP